MSREHLARARPPQYYNPAAISAMPQWASPLSPSPTPPRQPVVYLTGNHVVPNVGLGTTVVSPPIPAVAAGGSAVVAPTTAVVAGGWGVVAPTTAVIPLGTNPTTVVIPLGTVRERVAALESAVGAGGSAVGAGGSAVAAPTTVVAPEYWGNDENTVFVETLTDASRTSLRWEQEQLENTVMFSATGKGVRTIFHNGE